MLDEMMVLTPEKTVVSFRYASIGSRILAHILDLFFVLILILGFEYFIGQPFVPRVLSNFLEVVGPIVIIFSYFIFVEGLWNGFTLGKRAFNIRVCMIDGTPITFLGAVGRNLLRIADFLPSFYFLGIITMYMSSKSQRIGDMASQTMVIHGAIPALTGYIQAPHHAGIHPYEFHVGDLKGMTQEDYQALRRLCDRFPELPATIQEKLIKEIWFPFAENHAIKPVPGLHPLYLAEATVMKYGREKGYL